MQLIGFVGSFFLFVVSIFNIVIGVKRLHLLKEQGQPLAWYKQISIDLGIMCLLLSLIYLISPIDLVTNNGVSDAVGFTAMAVLGIPLIACFILIFKYRTLPQNQPQKSEEA